MKKTRNEFDVIQNMSLPVVDLFLLHRYTYTYVNVLHFSSHFLSIKTNLCLYIFYPVSSGAKMLVYVWLRIS